MINKKGPVVGVVMAARNIINAINLWLYSSLRRCRYWWNKGFNKKISRYVVQGKSMAGYLILDVITQHYTNQIDQMDLLLHSN